VTATSLRAPGALRSRARGLVLPVSLLGVLVLAALLGPILWSESATATNLQNSLLAPSLAHPMGTDQSGRDEFARFLAGARISLLAGLVVVVSSAAIGIPLGLLAGLRGGWIDTVILRALDIVLSFPPLVLAMAVAIGLGAGIWSAVVGAALGCIPVYARLVRSDVVQIQERGFVIAARTLGLTRTRVVIDHLLPHTRPTMLVQSSAVFGSAIITLSALSFIGLGAQIPTPEWGAMIAEGIASSLSGAWWVVVFPGVGLFLAVAGANLLADRLQDHERGL
jgi:peptide/nickel transport system permease protein